MTRDEFLKDFGRRLRSALEESGMTQKELAECCYLSEASVCSYLKGTQVPSAKAINNLCCVLGKSVRELVHVGEHID